MFEALIRRGILMTVIAGIIGVLGVVAALGLPIQMIPDLEVRTISVRTTWPGATPQDIEKEILVEQEEYLQRIPRPPGDDGYRVHRLGRDRAGVPLQRGHQ